MTPDAAIAAAQQALERKDTHYASELYESAARSVVESDQEQAAHFYRLASMYADANYVRQDRLAAEAQRLYESLADHDNQVVDILLARGRAAEDGGHAGKAFQYYAACVRKIAQMLTSSMTEYLSAGDLPLRVGAQTAELVDKLAYCARRMNEIEAGDD